MEANYSQYTQEIALALLGEPKQKRNNEWRWGANGSLVVDIEAGTYYDHEEKQGGGVLDLIIRETSAATVKAAISWLEEQGIKPKEDKPKQKAKLIKTYDYINEYGELVYQVCRFEPKDFRQRQPNGTGWKWSIKGVTPLPYRLPDMLAKPNATVLVVEGEKDADNLAALDLVATCNSGGAGKFDQALAHHFKGRKVVIVPDADKAGQEHVQTVAERLYPVADSIRVLTLPGLTGKQDVTDWLNSGHSKQELIEAAKAAPVWSPEPVKEPIKPKLDDSDEKPFKALGYNGSHYYYLPRGTEQVCEIKRGSHTSPSELMSLAPLEWWEVIYPKQSGGADWHAAANDCMRNCERRGIYSHEIERGRGAWYDKGRSVLHLGDRLLVDGQESAIIDHETRYIYTRQSALEYGVNARAATTEEATQVAQLFHQLNWSKPVHAQLLAGWCALAPICGALAWRPHVWLTAQRGAGKSWIQDHIINPLLGPSALMVQGSTTEAGIRQKLKQDARPIVFDEAESENQKSQTRMQTVIELARQSSSDSTAEIIKGTVQGNGMAFRMRSMFLLGSVNVSLVQAADESRFSVLSLQAPRKTVDEIARFESFSKSVDNLLAPDLCAKLRARSYQLMPVIRDNAKTFSRAVAELIGSQRLGDQVGTLIAGNYSLYFDDIVSLEDARLWIENVDFSDAEEAETEADENKCLSMILEYQIRFEGAHGVITRSIWEVVLCANSDEYIDGLTSIEANKVLLRHGLKVQDERLFVANNHSQLAKVFTNSPWSNGWKTVLARSKGAEKSKNALHFNSIRTRAVSIKISDFYTKMAQNT
jgi:putative DNA primase/helicase